MTAQTLVDFEKKPTASNWTVIDDVVMGGRSSGNFTITEDGYGKFFGEVSLENNGGFSSVRYSFGSVMVQAKNSIRIRVKGDGNSYQFRIKDKRSHRYSYATVFSTTGNWQTLEFNLANLSPRFRGRKVDLPNFDRNTIEELQFLIGNKKSESFKLLVASIEIMP